eukprot:COSAG01_NODE_26336_length_717_cov_0.983819_1_plen_195_part_00
MLRAGPTAKGRRRTKNHSVSHLHSISANPDRISDIPGEIAEAVHSCRDPRGAEGACVRARQAGPRGWIRGRPPGARRCAAPPRWAGAPPPPPSTAAGMVRRGVFPSFLRSVLTEIYRLHACCSGQATEGGIASAGPAGLASRGGAATTSGLLMMSTRANHVNHGGPVHHHHPSVRRNAPPRMPLAARQSRSMQW